MLSKRQADVAGDQSLSPAVAKIDRVRTVRFPELLAFPVEERQEQLRMAMSRAWREWTVLTLVVVVIWLVGSAAAGLWLGWKNAWILLFGGLWTGVLMQNAHRAQTRRQLQSMRPSRPPDSQERSASG